MQTKYFLLAVLLILASCTQAPTMSQETNQTPATNNLTTTGSEKGIERWRSLDINAATFLVNDGRVAVRAFLEEGQEVNLDLQTPTHIRIQRVTTNSIDVQINNHTYTVQEQEELVTDNNIRFYLDETITTTRS